MDPALRARLPQAEHATRFWWVRHAHVPSVESRMYGSLDLDCDTSDANLFRGIASRLPENAAWVTSQLKRTHQTADALIAAGAPEPLVITEDPDISEMNFGDYNGITHAELFAARSEDPYLGFWPMSPHEQAPNGESFTILRDRVQAFVDRTLEAVPRGDVVCIAHRGTILAALQIALDLPLTTAVAFAVGNVSLTTLVHHADVKPGGPLWRVEQTGWLPA